MPVTTERGVLLINKEQFSQLKGSFSLAAARYSTVYTEWYMVSIECDDARIRMNVASVKCKCKESLFHIPRLGVDVRSSNIEMTLNTKGNKQISSPA